MSVEPAAVTFSVERHSDVTLLYQRYYLIGLEETGPLRLIPSLGRAGRPSARLAAWARLARFRALVPGARVRVDAGRVGRYRAAGTSFVIDARDSAAIDEEVAATSDVYFKANRWPSVDYPANVRPIVNGNGILAPRRIAWLQGLRDQPRQVDVAAIVRLWGSDHAVRVFEELARLDCSKRLLAVFPAGFPPELADRHRRRLERAGVPWTTRPLRPAELWRTLASARVVFARPGKHRCFPWRTIDLLAMGACAVFDELPPARWPEPLEPGIHLASAGVGADADDADYSRLSDTIAGLLADPHAGDAMRAAAAAYFDAHASPASVGRYVRETIAG